MFTQEDVGRVLFIDPRPWYLRVWHFIWFKILRKKRSTNGAYIIQSVDSSTVITIDRGMGDKDGKTTVTGCSEGVVVGTPRR